MDNGLIGRSGQVRKYRFDPDLIHGQATPQIYALSGKEVVQSISDNISSIKQDLDCDRIGLLVSILAHIILFLLMIFGLPGSGSRTSPSVIYSVSIEGSNTLGGIQQVPSAKQSTPVAPPKKVSAPPPPKQTEDKTVKTETVKKEVAPNKPEEKAELSLKQKTQTKPTPTPPPKAAVQTKTATTQTQKATQKNTATTKTPVKPVDTKAEVNKNFEQALQRYLGESTAAGGVGFGGDGRGGRGMGGGVVKPPEWFLYKDLLESTIRRGWNWHDTSSTLVATVSFRISQRGDVSDVRLVQSSGSSYYDESIIRAVKKATPVPPPPAEFYNDFSFVELDFKPQ